MRLRLRNPVAASLLRHPDADADAGTMSFTPNILL